MKRILIEVLQKLRNHNIYYIKIDSNVSGFFALLREALSYICYADELGMKPYIVYGNKTLYTEKKAVKGTRNVFEYYFKQPLYGCDSLFFPWNINVIRSSIRDKNEMELKYNKKLFSYEVENAYIDRMALIYNRYIRLNSHTVKILEHSIIKKLDHKKTLGVHIRGTDFNKKFNKHPVPVSIDEYIKKVYEGINRFKYRQVFVATDDIRCLEEIKAKLKLPIVYYENTMRSENNRSVAFIDNNRKNDRYLLGLEVLRDAYTLASCSGFIGCLSQVDICVQIIKKSRGRNFEYLQIIDNGVFTNEKDCWEPRD